MQSLDVDVILEQIGGFGKFQKKVLFLLSLLSAAGGLAIVVFVFTGFEPKYRCRVSECESIDNASYYANNSCDETEKACLPQFRVPSWYSESTIPRINQCQ